VEYGLCFELCKEKNEIELNKTKNFICWYNTGMLGHVNWLLKKMKLC
jgi:hypothetical protein